MLQGCLQGKSGDERDSHRTCTAESCECKRLQQPTWSLLAALWGLEGGFAKFAMTLLMLGFRCSRPSSPLRTASSGSGDPGGTADGNGAPGGTADASGVCTVSYADPVSLCCLDRVRPALEHCKESLTRRWQRRWQIVRVGAIVCTAQQWLPNLCKELL